MLVGVDLVFGEVTRRDGLSSWRVIFFVAAGMLSGKWGANYIAKSDGKVQLFMKEQIHFRPYYFSDLV